MAEIIPFPNIPRLAEADCEKKEQIAPTLLARANRWLERARRRAEMRAELPSLDDAALRDLGLTRAEAAAEASRPFWRA
ncbi:MAG: DUF1127 domain-containing protein [Pseudomonadota bacterium]